MKDKKLVIFCQASADVIYILDIIKEYNEAVIYTTLTHQTREFILSLSLPNVTLIDLPKINFSFYNPLSIIEARLNFKKILKESFQIKLTRIVFFSTSYDYITAGCINHLALSNEVLYYNHYDYITSISEVKSHSIIRLIKRLVYSFITRASYKSNSEVNFPKFNIDKINITELKITFKPKIKVKYLYTINSHKSRNIVLYLAPFELDWLKDRDRLDFLKFIKNMTESGYAIFLKCHPRLKEIEDLDSLIFTKIPKYIPGEFIDFKYVHAVIGFTSTSLVYPALTKSAKTFSLLDIFLFRDEKSHLEYKHYLLKSSDRILFSFEKLKNHLNLINYK